MTEGTSGRRTGRPPRRPGEPEAPRTPPRGHLVREAVRQVRDGTSVLVLGAPGSGRSHLARRVVDSVPELRVLSVRSATSAPGLIVSTVHDPAQGSAPGTVRRVPSGTAGVDDLAGTGGSTVVLADDAHLLDAEHLQMLCELATDGRVVLVATADATAGAGTAHGAAAARLTTLWLDGRAGRVDLVGLSEAEGHELIRSVAGSRPLDLALRHHILVAAGGSPATIRELTLEALRDDRATTNRDLLRLHGPGLLPPRTVQRARHRLDLLSEHDRESLVLLARLSRLDPERAVHYVGDATLRRLLRHGCVTPVGPGTTALRATPVDAEALLADGQAWSADGPSARALRSMVDLDTAGLVLDPFECLLLSDAWLEAADGPTGPTPTVAPDQVSRIATVAARKSTAMLQPYRALSHAMLALDTHPTGAAAIEASRALAALGSTRAAHEVLARVPPGTSGDERELVALWRAELDDWEDARSDGEPARLREPDAAPARTVATVERLRGAVHALRAMRWRESLDLATGLVDDDRAGLVVRLRACGLAGMAAAFLGHGAQLESITETGRRLHDALARQAGSASAQQVVDEGTAFFSGSAAAHLACSLGWVEMPARLDALVRRAVAARDVAHTSTLSALAGYLALADGDDVTAELELGAAIDRAPRPTTHETHAWLVTVRATALARLGRAVEAERLCAELEAPGATVSAWSAYLVESVRHLAAPTTSLPAVAPSPLGVEAAALQPTIALLAAAEAAASHDGRVSRQDLVDAATTARQQTDIGSLQAVADYVIAASTADAGSLADLTRTFEGLGMRHLADACEEQALRLLDPDSPHALSAWRDRANRAESEPAEEPLTAREREVAVLAGRGLSNRDIAARLFLSVRTVESHLYLARRKLGAASRRDLADRLGDDA